MVREKKQFNIVICGVGGQGLITITKILAEAAMIEGLEVKTSELHGLSQRGGSVETHVRFGKDIFSPLVKQESANLIISIEAQESLKSCYYSSKKAGTVFLVNDFIAPILGQEDGKIKDVIKELEKCSGKVILTPATTISEKELGNSVLAGIYLMNLALFKGIIPLKESSVLKAIERIVPAKYFDLNKRAFDLAKKKA